MLTPSRLRLARLHVGLPQYVVAKRAGLVPSRLSVLECGYDTPSGYERRALARVLGVPAEELFSPEPIVQDPASASAEVAEQQPITH